MKALLSFIEEEAQPVAVIEILDDQNFSLYKEKQRFPTDAELQSDWNGMTLKEYLDRECARTMLNIQARWDKEMERQQKVITDRPAAVAKVQELNQTLAGEKTNADLTDAMATLTIEGRKPLTLS